MLGLVRFLLAISVVITHLVRPEIHYGRYAVYLFFALSGYLITLVLDKKYQNRLGTFWASRLLRLWPSYVFMWLLTIILISTAGIYDGDISRIATVPKLFMIWNLTSGQPMGIAWTLTAELLAYCAMSLGLSRTAERTYLWLAASSLLTLFFGFNLYGSLYGHPFQYSLYFSVGATGYWMGLKLPKDKGFFQVIGAMSYPVYLAHQTIGVTVQQLSGQDYGWALFWYSMPITLGVSWAVVEFIEKPVDKLRRRWSTNT